MLLLNLTKFQVNYSSIYPHHHIRILYLMCVVFLTLSLHAQNKKETRFNLSFQDVTLDKFVKEMEKATGFTFIYGEDIKLAHRINLQARQLLLHEILQKVFKNESIKFEISGNHILLFQRSVPQKTVSRKFTISGYVTDGASSETLIGANILESRHSSGTATNPFGFYTLTLPEGDIELTYSYLGYKAQNSRFKLTKDTLLNIHLKSDNQLNEIVIVSDKREGNIQNTAMGVHDIPMAQIQHTPVIFGEADLLKTIQLMPGVQAGTEGFSGLYVRGGSSDQNLILLDGIPVYNADHLMGIFSIFTPEAVKKVTLFKSSFPARYGGRLSSIVDVRTNDGDMKQYHGAISVGLLTNKLHLEGPVWKDHTSFSFSARSTHTAFLSNLIKNSDGSYNYYFYDFNAKLNHIFNDRSRLFIGAYHGKDHYHYNSNYETPWEYENKESNPQNSIYKDKNRLNWGNTILSTRWNYVFNNQLFSNTTIAYNRYQMSLNSEMNELRRNQSTLQHNYKYGTDYRSGIRDYSARMDFDYTPSPTHHIKFGTEYIYHTFRPETTTSKIKEEENGVTMQDTLYSNNNSKELYGHEVSVYAEDNFDLNSRISANAGVHLSWFNTQGKNYWAVQPRLSVRYRFLPDFSVKASYTCMAQYVHLLSATPFSMPTDLWVPITKNIRPMHSNQYSLGGYYTGISGWEFSVEGYYKQLYNVLEYQDGVTMLGTSTNWEDKVESGKGYSMGIEFMAQKTLGKTTGWLSYTLSKTDRQFKNGNISNGARFPYKYDRRHNISLCLNHKFNERIDIGASWIFYTGGAISTPERQTVFIRPDGTTENAPYIPHRNNYRLPATHRLNLGINFNKKTKHGMRTWNISIYNVYNAMNPNLVYAQWENSARYYYPDQEGSHLSNTGNNKVVIKKITLLPIIPSVSYTYRF